MNRQESQVRQYFDRIATDYASRYSTGSVYHSYFFHERLEEAVRGLDFEGKSILDVGAGTGALYNYLKAHFQSFEYTGTDISSIMLETSNIPLANRRIGALADIQMPKHGFDFIFMLGVTSYMSQTEFQTHLALFQKYLNPGGKAVISFTHRRSIDHFFRFFLKLVLRPFAKTSFVASQPFKITAYSLPQIKTILGQKFDIQRLAWLNQTCSPFNHLLPRLSLSLARFFKRKFSHTIFLPVLSADFLVEIKLQ
ncbi:MAG: class I SAM-dependent methyltransferase [Saprospiraceae bacterium]|nr:class I SAM-dependent methyltransferase [Saprospiraceae bacterium]